MLFTQLINLKWAHWAKAHIYSFIHKRFCDEYIYIDGSRHLASPYFSFCCICFLRIHKKETEPHLGNNLGCTGQQHQSIERKKKELVTIGSFALM